MFRALVSTFFFIFTIISMGAGVLFVAFFYYGQDLPSYSFLKNYCPTQTSKIYSRHGELIQEHSKEDRSFIPIENVPLKVINAFLCAEDQNFLEHPGIDIMGLLRAIIVNTIRVNWMSRPMGASTITQQVTKNFIIGNERKLKRKIQEAILSMRLERELSKGRILELYLNQIYLGCSYYGIVAAARGYFGKKLEDLSIEESAMLAALPKAPSIYSPYKHPDRILNRRNWILRRMCDANFITKTSYNKAVLEPIRTFKKKNREGNEENLYFLEAMKNVCNVKNLDTNGVSIFSTVDNRLQKIMHDTLSQYLELYDTKYGWWRGPLASIDIKNDNWIKALKKAKKQVSRSGGASIGVVLGTRKNGVIKVGLSSGKIISVSTKKWYYFLNKGSKERRVQRVVKISDIVKFGDVVAVKGKSLHQYPEITGGMVLMNADTGEVLALSGGYSFKYNQFNSVTQSNRQYGSTFKTIIYLAAIESGYGLEHQVLDAPIQVKTSSGIYAPKNLIKGRSYGVISLRRGFAHSYNQLTVRLVVQIGLKKVAEVTERLKIMKKLPLYYSVALGSCQGTLLNLTNGYCQIINGGFGVKPIFIKNIFSFSGENLDKKNNKFRINNKILSFSKLEKNDEPEFFTNTKRVINPYHARLASQLLDDVVEFGSGRRIRYLRGLIGANNVGGKTGTTNDNKDTWFIGYIKFPNGKKYVIGTFLGFPIPRSLGSKATGARLAMPLFELFVKRSHEILKVTN